MTPFRVFQVSIAALVVMAHVWIVQALSAAPGTATYGASGASVALAQAGTPQPSPTATATVTPVPVVTVIVVLATPTPADNASADNDADDNDAADNDDADNNSRNADNDSGDNDGGDNDDADNDAGDNDGGDNDAADNDVGGTALDLPRRPTTTQAAAPVCSDPGQETLFQSANQRVQVRVFPSGGPSIRAEIRPVFDLLSIPTPPGQLVGLLLYDVVAGACADGGAQVTPFRVFPGEVNLQFQYTDTEVLGLDEARLEIAHLDFQTVQWTRVERQSLNAAGNAIGATVTQTGYYAVYQRP